ncbi:hypothetical protein ckrop_1612 [Corynebacterium kroppenstedtii DSM 44385]|uniref:Uncharacterized protein n=1 Tax=Corynebacterium kroppenstedtii (strain DSM 44385 / JCM 11950 / CIP 105744 / CCUG 35717) TaxID=645127 RepID=C4LKI6_CORK4|nr:hypothetical protein ckrop_1612 [Corynebacterium kroppenstedtii DSM 44385]
MCSFYRSLSGRSPRIKATRSLRVINTYWAPGLVVPLHLATTIPTTASSF